MQQWTNLWEDITEVTHGSEGDTEVRVVQPLLRALGWRQDCVHAKVTLTVQLGREGKSGIADFVVAPIGVDPRTNGLIVVEAKKPGETLKGARQQAESYARACRASFLLLTDGMMLEVCQMSLVAEPILLLSLPVCEVQDRREDVKRWLTPQAIQNFLQEHTEGRLGLATADVQAQRGQEVRERRYDLAAQLLRTFGEDAVTLIDDLLGRQSPWRDRLDEAKTEEACSALFRELWPRDFSPQQRALVHEIVVVDVHSPADLARLILSKGYSDHTQQTQGALTLTGIEETQVFALSSLTLEEGETSFGPESAALRALGIPLLTPWTQALQERFEAYRQEQIEAFGQWFTTVADDGPMLEEQVIKNAIHEEYGAAFSALRGVETAGWPPERRVARYRLLGTLSRLRGDSERAQEYYVHATDLLEQLPPQALWLKRRLLLDLNVLHDDDLNGHLTRHDRMLAVPVWYSIPVIDHCEVEMANHLTREAHEQIQARATTYRSSTLIFDAWRAYVKGMFFAFSIGDHYAVRGLHLHWARLLLMLPVPPLEHILQVLWAINEEALLSQVIRTDPLKAYEAWAAWDQVLLQRPVNPRGYDSEQKHLTILKVVPLLAPLLRDDTVVRLTTELVNGFVEHHRRSRSVQRRNQYEPVPMIEGRNFTATYAVEALAALGGQVPLTPGQVRALVTSLEGHAFDHLSAWSVLAGHSWRPEDFPAALQALTLLPTQVRAWDAETLVAFLSKLTVAYPQESGFRAALLRFLLVPAPGPPDATPTSSQWSAFSLDDDGLDDTSRWYHLLQRFEPEAAAFVREYAPPFFAQTVQRLRETTGGEAVRLGQSHPIRWLSLLLTNYPEALSPCETESLLTALIDAAGNDRIIVNHKLDLFVALREAWPTVSEEGQARLRKHLQQSAEGHVLARLTPHRGPGHAPTNAPVHFARARLYASIGLPFEQDLDVLHEVLAASDHFDRERALRTLGDLLKSEVLRAGDYHALLVSLAGSTARHSSYALYLAVRFAPGVGSLWRSATVRVMAEQRAGGALPSLLALLAATEQLPAGHEIRARALSVLSGLQTHPHREIREHATALLTE